MTQVGTLLRSSDLQPQITRKTPQGITKNYEISNWLNGYDDSRNLSFIGPSAPVLLITGDRAPLAPP